MTKRIDKILEERDQLPLGLALDDAAVFDNFILHADNSLALDSLRRLSGADAPQSSAPQAERFVFLWGEGSPGLTHLLQATCHSASSEGRAAVYLSMAERQQLSPELFDGLESLDLVCLDDLDALAGDDEWEAALFTAFNRMKESSTTLLVASRLAPANLPIGLADLKSRLQSGLTLRLTALSDLQKREALILRAAERGILMSDAVADYIMLRSERALPALIAVLDRLDASTLQQQRQLTIPLVKVTLGW